MKALINILADFFSLIYPNICAACGDNLVSNEKVLCTMCLYKLPKTRFHHEKDNPVNQLFWGRVQVENATAFFSFTKGSSFRKLIHKLKYKGRKDIGQFLGKQLGIELAESGEFGNIDIIVPVPLHPKREKKRGYNQSEYIALGVAEGLNIPTDCVNFYRKISNVSQTKKSRFDRWDNVATIFAVKNPDAFAGKHILIVDDVITTGSTLEACIAVLLEINGTKVSVATLAFAN